MRSGNPPPRNLGFEKNVLGSVIHHLDCLDEIADIGLKASDFYFEAHGRIYSAILQLCDDGSPITEQTVRGKFQVDTETLARISEATGFVPDVFNVRHYAVELIQLWAKRQTQRIYADAAAEAANGQPAEDIFQSVNERLEPIQQRLSALPNSRKGKEGNGPRPWQTPEPHIDLSSDAFYGLAGDLVRALDPHTEADPVGILVQFLTCFGSVIGRTAHLEVEDTRHFSNIFAVLVGQSSKGRKGTSLERVKRFFEDIDADWYANRNIHGLSSGEGLIFQVRDGEEREETDSKKPIDQGVTDKRLLVTESEFGQVLRQLERPGNTLSPIIRVAWDTGSLRSSTKNSPLKAIGAHISFIGHITKNELNGYLLKTEIFNGFSNRFLWLFVRRSKLLPDGGNLHWEVRHNLIQRIRDVVEFARRAGPMERDEDAAQLWRKVYPQISAELSGVVGAVTSRAEAQVARLSMLYALLDKSAYIRVSHLQAALALWKYAEESAHFIFSTIPENSTAARLYENVLTAGDKGLSRTKVNQLFGNNLEGEKLDRAATLLVSRGLIREERETPGPSGGRPGTRFFPVGGSAGRASSSIRSTKETKETMKPIAEGVGPIEERQNLSVGRV